MNIFMLAIIAITTYNKETIPTEVVDSSISLLKKSNFSISRNLYPDKYYMLPDYNAKFYTAGDLSQLFFKKQVAFRTADNSLIAENDGGILTVTSNHFQYKSIKVAVADSSASDLERELENLGINMDGAVYDAKEKLFYRMYNNANLFNMSIQAKLDKEGNICYVNAYWPKELSAGESKRFSFLESAVRMKDFFPDGGAIEKVELGYSLHSIGGEKYTFVPAWRVKVDGELRIVE